MLVKLISRPSNVLFVHLYISQAELYICTLVGPALSRNKDNYTEISPVLYITLTRCSFRAVARGGAMGGFPLLDYISHIALFTKKKLAFLLAIYFKVRAKNHDENIFIIILYYWKLKPLRKKNLVTVLGLVDWSIVESNYKDMHYCP